METWYREADRAAAGAREGTIKGTFERLNFKVFFVSVNRKDPSDAFLKRFEDIPRKIQKASSSETVQDSGMSVRDKETHQPGIIFRADEIRWLGRDSVSVEGGYYCGGRCAAEKIFALERKNGKWIVSKEQVKAIS